MNQPLIKWTGSKRSLAKQIVSKFPTNLNNYYEPFVGGGSVFFYCLKNNLFENYYLSDINNNLIQIYNIVKHNPLSLVNSYEEQFFKLKKDKNFYYTQRDLFNKEKDPYIFYFLTRTCYNGTIRYNKSGEFNTSLHFNRDGIEPKKLNKIITYYNKLLNDNNIIFSCKSFEEVEINNDNSLVYLDPPYSNSKSLYYGNINLNSLYDWINKLNCHWFMNLNGVSSKDNKINPDINNYEITKIKSGKSSFSKLKAKEVNVEEYLYYHINKLKKNSLD